MFNFVLIMLSLIPFAIAAKCIAGIILLILGEHFGDDE